MCVCVNIYSLIHRMQILHIQSLQIIQKQTFLQKKHSSFCKLIKYHLFFDTQLPS